MDEIVSIPSVYFQRVIFDHCHRFREYATYCRQLLYFQIAFADIRERSQRKIEGELEKERVKKF